MAILPDFPGLCVEVWSNDSALREHDAGEDDGATTGDTVTKYLEVHSGQQFGIKVKIKPDFVYASTDLTAHVNVDGSCLQKPLWRAKDLQLRGITRLIEGVAIYKRSAGAERPLSFSDLTTSDEGLQSLTNEERKRLKSLGIISICFHRIHVVGECFEPVELQHSNALSVVPEKALKGATISHTTQLGEEVPKKFSLWNSVPIDEKPFATFNFHYRSLAALKTMGIVPRTPSPPPLEDRDLEELTREELEELARQLKKHKAANTRVKREGIKQEAPDEGDHDAVPPASSADGEIAVTGSNPCKRRKTAHNVDSEVEIVDLTG